MFFVVVVAAAGVGEKSVRTEHVDGETASNLQASLSFCMDVVAVFSASYYDAHYHSFLLFCPWNWYLLRFQFHGSQGYQAEMVHLICPLDLPQMKQTLAL